MLFCALPCQRVLSQPLTNPQSRSVARNRSTSAQRWQWGRYRASLRPSIFLKLRGWPGLDPGTPSALRHFGCKFSHIFFLCKFSSSWSRIIFCVNSRIKWLLSHVRDCPCAFQPRKLAQDIKRLLSHVHVHVDCPGSRKMWVMGCPSLGPGIFCVNSRVRGESFKSMVF